MKYISLYSALNHFGTKKEIAKACKCSPAAVQRAFKDTDEGREVYKVRTDGKVTQLVRKQEKFAVVKGRA